jgi:hypothetical protein
MSHFQTRYQITTMVWERHNIYKYQITHTVTNATYIYIYILSHDRLQTEFGLVITLIGHFKTRLVTNLYRSLSHKGQCSVTVFTMLPGTIFHLRTIICSRDHILAGWRPTHTNIRLVYLPALL